MLSIATLPSCVTPSAHPALAQSLVASRYVIGPRLGRGSQGVVYRAHDSRLDREVALKFLPDQLADDEHARQRFIREAHAAARAEHSSICTIHSIESTDEGHLFIVMPYYEGRTLKDVLHDGPLTPDEAIEIAAQLAEGLSAAHLRGVVHRDIKPANLMLTEDGVKILDFGLAKTIDSARITIEGSMLGSATYMSPEQARCQSAGPRSDVWSLGVVLFEMLAGVPPYQGTHTDAVCYAIRHDDPPALPLKGGGIAKQLRAIVARALRKDPRRRPSALDLARALRTLQTSTEPATTQAASPESRRRKPVAADTLSSATRRSVSTSCRRGFVPSVLYAG